MDNNFQSKLSHKLVRYGMILFLLGLLTGFGIPLMRNPRMGLASHLEAVMNGMFLILLGLIWQKLRLSVGALKWGYALSLFGTYTNWVTNLLAAIWGAGAEMMPIAGGGYQGVAWQEVLIKVGLGSLSLAMTAVCIIVLWGLKSSTSENLFRVIQREEP
jgi:hydroxylaminobenzene mutase